MTGFAPVKATLIGWLNTRPELVGQGQPLAMGAVNKPLRSAAKGAYAYLYQLGGDNNFSAEGGICRARISARIESLTEKGAEDGALAYANALLRIPLDRPVVRGWRLLAVDAINGPGYTGTGSDLESFIVDADIYVGENTVSP